MLMINSRKLHFLSLLIISGLLLFGTGCYVDHGQAVCGCCLLIDDMNKRHSYQMHIMQMDDFSICNDQKTDCVTWNSDRSIRYDRCITMLMPYGTNIKKLAPFFKYQGDMAYVGKSKQISGETVNDFTYPVAYRVQSRSGSSTYYYVKVITAPEKTICAFLLTGCSLGRRFEGVIDQKTKTISVMLPSQEAYCRPKSKLKATVLYSGSSIVGPEELDLTSRVIYTVKAKDGSSVNYTVNVTVVPESTIYDFMIDTADTTWRDCPLALCDPPDTLYSGHIDQENKLITAALPDRDGIDIKKLLVRFKYTGGLVFGGKVWQTSGIEVKDFTSPVIYRLQARDGSSAEYTVKVTLIPEKTMTGFYLSECPDYCEKYYGVVDEKTKTIHVLLPDDKKGKALSRLKAHFTYSGSSVFVDKTKQISGITENDYSFPVVYRVTARDGSSANYEIRVSFPTDARIN